MCICVCVCVCVLCVCVHSYMYICMSLYVCIFIYVCMCFVYIYTERPRITQSKHVSRPAHASSTEAENNQKRSSQKGQWRKSPGQEPAQKRSGESNRNVQWLSIRSRESSDTVGIFFLFLFYFFLFFLIVSNLLLLLF